MSTGYLITGIAVMAVMTYLIRALPMVLFRKKITNVWLQSFLYYVPYAVLSAMTFPAIFYSTGSTAGATAGCITAILLSYKKQSLLVVAVGASLAAYLVALVF